MRSGYFSVHEDERLRAMLKLGKSDEQIADALNRKVRSVHDRRIVLKLYREDPLPGSTRKGLSYADLRAKWKPVAGNPVDHSAACRLHLMDLVVAYGGLTKRSAAEALEYAKAKYAAAVEAGIVSGSVNVRSYANPFADNRSFTGSHFADVG